MYNFSIFCVAVAGGIIFSTEQQGSDPQNAKGIQQVMGAGAVELYVSLKLFCS